MVWGGDIRAFNNRSHLVAGDLYGHTFWNARPNNVSYRCASKVMPCRVRALHARPAGEGRMSSARHVIMSRRHAEGAPGFCWQGQRAGFHGGHRACTRCRILPGRIRRPSVPHRREESAGVP